MNVLTVIIIAPHLNVSGAVNAAIGLTKELRKYCNISIAKMSNKNNESYNEELFIKEFKCKNILGFTKNILPNKFRTLLYHSEISKYIKNSNFDIVHIHNPIPTNEMKRIAKQCVSNNIPYVVSTHGFNEIINGINSYRLKGIFIKLLWKLLIDIPFRYVVKNANLIYALSSYEIKDLTSVGIKKKNIRIITNGVNEDYLKPVSQEDINKVKTRYKLDIDSSLPTFIFLGNHTRNKGIEFLLDTFILLKKEFQLIICGKKRNDIDYEYYTNKTSGSKKIVFTDMIYEWEVRALFACSHCFVYATFADTLPLVILEAMASGLPIVASRVGGIPFQIDKSNGFLFEVGNQKQLLKILNKICTDLSILNDLSENSVNKIKAMFLWSEIAKSAYKNYLDLLRK